MKSDYLKRFELENLEKVAKGCQKVSAIDICDKAPTPAIVPIEAEVLLRMIKEIKRRRFQSHRYWLTQAKK